MELDLSQAQAVARRMGMPLADWPEELWVELSAGSSRIKREDFIRIVNELTTANVGRSGTFSGDAMPTALEDDEEIFAADGELEHSADAALAVGTFTEDPDDPLELGGLIIPDLAVVGANHSPPSKEVSNSSISPRASFEAIANSSAALFDEEEEVFVH
jgi:hypothetical protein